MFTMFLNATTCITLSNIKIDLAFCSIKSLSIIVFYTCFLYLYRTGLNVKLYLSATHYYNTCNRVAFAILLLQSWIVITVIEV